MENKINIAELLKDCPNGMELDCTMYQDVYFDYIDELNIIHCYIQGNNSKVGISFNKFGCYSELNQAKCVIFPKGKTTWEEFGVHYPTKFITPICKKPIFQIGDKVQNKQTGYINVIKHINDKNYMFNDGIYIFDNEDGFAIKKQHEWRKI